MAAKGHGDKLFCGYADGKVTLIKINHYGVEGIYNYNIFERLILKKIKYEKIVNEEILVKSTENSSAVTSLDTYDISADGKDDLIVGRRDGTVQVYSLPSDENDIDNEIRLVYNEVYVKITNNSV